MPRTSSRSGPALKPVSTNRFSRAAAARLHALLLAGLCLPAGAAAGESPAEATAPDPENGAVSSPAQGVVVRWNLNERRYEAPSPEQKAHVLRQLQEMLAEGRLGTGVEAPEKVEVETLPGGVRRARLPLSLMNVSLLRPGPDGALHAACVAGPAVLDEALQSPAAPAAPVE